MTWCTYTEPEIARVGITEREVQVRGADVTTFTRNLAEVDRAILDGETEGYVRLYMNRPDGRLIGATMVSVHAGESIGEAVLAMTRRRKVGVLGGVIHPYPTQAETIKRAADLQFRSRLRPWMRNALRKYFAFRT